MQEKFPNGTAPQDGEEQRLYENLRNWDDEIINQKMEDLGIPNVKLTSKRKYILGMIDSLADIDTKKFFFRNSDFMEIANISKAPFMETIKYFSKLGIIKRVSGVRGKASQYQFNEKNLKKLPLENQTLNTKKNQTLNGVSPSVLGDSSEYGLGKGSGQKQSVENQPPHTQSHTQSQLQKQLQQQLQSHLQLQEQLQLQGYSQGQMEELIKNLIISIDNNTRVKSEDDAKLIESNNTLAQVIANTKDEIIEELKKISTSIENNTRVNSKVIEEKDKIIEENNKLIKELQVKLQSSSMDNNGKSNGEIQPSIDTKDETNDKVDNTPIESSTVQSESNSNVIEESDNSKDVKESSSNSNGEVQDPSSSNIDKILSHQLDVVSKDPIKDKAWKREQQKKADTKTASKTTVQDAKTTVQESNSNESERSYALNKLKYEIVEPFKRKIINADSYEKLMTTQEEFGKTASKFYTTHDDVITQSEMKSFINEVRMVFQQKEEELTPKADANETPSKSNGIVQESSKEDEASKRFQPNKETTPKVENREEKKETTAEPTTADSKNIEVPNADTSDSKEEQEKLDREVDEAASSIFLEDNSQKASTKESEEVKFPETRVIPLREGEQRQVQELLGNQTINALLKDYSPFGSKKTYIEILTEIRKVATKGKYIQRVVKAYLNEIESKGYYCNVEDAMKPLDDSKEEKETTAENNHQDNEESNSCQLEEEKMAMAAACSHDETQDAEF